MAGDRDRDDLGYRKLWIRWDILVPFGLDRYDLFVGFVSGSQRRNLFVPRDQGAHLERGDAQARDGGTVVGRATGD